jgi:hypothetical protein
VVVLLVRESRVRRGMFVAKRRRDVNILAQISVKGVEVARREGYIPNS